MESQTFQVEVETVLRNILKRDDIVSITQVLGAADPEVRAEICRQFKENKMLRESFQTATLIFDEFID